jgi:hypothetical protein
VSFSGELNVPTYAIKGGSGSAANANEDPTTNGETNNAAVRKNERRED